MLIEVVFKNKKFGTILPTRLESLLAANLVIAFRRSEGWVVVGEEPIRKSGDEGKYEGFDRRTCKFALWPKN